MSRTSVRDSRLNIHQTHIVLICVKLIYTFFNLLLMFMNGIEGVNPLFQSLPSLRLLAVLPVQVQVA